jgi:hypothetical protein
VGARQGQAGRERTTGLIGGGWPLVAGLRRPALGIAAPKPASQDVVLNVSKVASNSFAGAPGIGHNRVLVEGRFGASHLMRWARLLKRGFDIDMQRCPNCGGGELKIIAAILERPVIEKILTHLGLQVRAPPRAAERGQSLQAA